MIDCRKKQRVKLKRGEIVTVKIRKTYHSWYGTRYYYGKLKLEKADNPDYELEQV